ncbi:MAG: type II toxin-antitoxin system VapC family toxin [Planctomycetota bacterium]
MIVADTSAVIALIDADDRHHRAVREIFEADRGAWVMPWAVLPEVDDLVLKHVGAAAEHAFVLDLAEGNLRVEWGEEGDLRRAAGLSRRYRSLGLGLVDAVVMAVSERLGAEAIATLDRRHFGVVAIRGRPALLP